MQLKGYIGETTAYDKKLMLERKDPTSWLKSVSAFANTQGGRPATAAKETRFERINEMDKKLLMMLAAALAVAFGARAETETVGGYTWTYEINGDTAEIYNDGFVAISPAPTGAVMIPSTLGGNPDPVYEVTERDVMVRLCAVGASKDVLGRESGGDVTQNVTQSVTQNVTQNTVRKLTKTQLNILGLIRGDGSISQAKIAEELGISRRTVLRNIAAMPDIVRRVGPDKGGHWELSEANNEGVHP